ncbi:hypothetical protein GJ496_006264 [Pomphorhynchus laevis]|nr:hypothetical protein GJ496_006264 [Pomphorhynchus laevis]
MEPVNRIRHTSGRFTQQGERHDDCAKTRECRNSGSKLAFLASNQATATLPIPPEVDITMGKKFPFSV